MSFSLKIIPYRWRGHFDMLNDKVRNKAYASSIIQANDNHGIDTSSDNSSCNNGNDGCNESDIIVVDKNGDNKENNSCRSTKFLIKDNENEGVNGMETESSIGTAIFSINNDKADVNHMRYKNNIAKEEEEDCDLWFEIGCGSGLLSCLTAKHSKAHIVAFECVSQLAEIARETVAKNGLSQRITINSCHTNFIDPQYFTQIYGKAAIGCVRYENHSHIHI